MLKIVFMYYLLVILFLFARFLYQKPQYRSYKNHIKYSFNTWLFAHRIGRLSPSYDAITDPAQRIIFLHDHFGKDINHPLMERELIDQYGMC